MLLALLHSSSHARSEPAVSEHLASMHLALALLLCAGYGAGCRPPGRQEPSATVNVSLVSLIADPDRYHGRTVAVVGVLRLDFEGTALYLHREDYEERISTNAVWLRFDGDHGMSDRRELGGQYVAVRGRFHGDDKGFGRMYAATIAVELVSPVKALK